jgi:hypothetical protein
MLDQIRFSVGGSEQHLQKLLTQSTLHGHVSSYRPHLGRGRSVFDRFASVMRSPITY